MRPINATKDTTITANIKVKTICANCLNILFNFLISGQVDLAGIIFYIFHFFVG